MFAVAACEFLPLAIRQLVLHGNPTRVSESGHIANGEY